MKYAISVLGQNRNCVNSSSYERFILFYFILFFFDEIVTRLFSNMVLAIFLFPWRFENWIRISMYNLLFSLTLLNLSVIVGFLFFVNAYDEKCMMEE